MTFIFSLTGYRYQRKLRATHSPSLSLAGSEDSLGFSTTTSCLTIAAQQSPAAQSCFPAHFQLRRAFHPTQDSRQFRLGRSILKGFHREWVGLPLDSLSQQLESSIYMFRHASTIQNLAKGEKAPIISLGSRSGDIHKNERDIGIIGSSESRKARNPSWPLLTVFLVRIRGWARLCACRRQVVAVKSIFRGFNLTAFESFVSIYEENPKVHLCNCSLYQQGAQRQRSRCGSAVIQTILRILSRILLSSYIIPQIQHRVLLPTWRLYKMGSAREGDLKERIRLLLQYIKR